MPDTERNIGSLYYDVEARFEKLEQQLAEYENRMSESLRISFEADTRSLATFRSDLMAAAENITVTLDTSQAQAQLAAMGGGEQATMLTEADVVSGTLSREVAGALSPQAANALRSGYGGGGAGFPLRPFMAAMLAIKGLEAVEGSYDYAFGDRDPEIDPGSIAAIKNEEQLLKHMRSGLMGLTGFGRDVGNFIEHHQGDPVLRHFGAGLDKFFPNLDDASSLQDLEKRIKQEEKLTKDAAMEHRLTGLTTGAADFSKLAQEQLDEAQEPEGLGKKLKEIDRAATKLADAFNKKADEIEHAAVGNLPQARAARDFAAQLRDQAKSIPEALDTAERNEAIQEDRDRQNDVRGGIEFQSSQSGLMATGLEAAAAGDTVTARVAAIEARQAAYIEAAENRYFSRANLALPLGDRGRFSESDLSNAELSATRISEAERQGFARHRDIHLMGEGFEEDELRMSLTDPEGARILQIRNRAAIAMQSAGADRDEFGHAQRIGQLQLQDEQAKLIRGLRGETVDFAATSFSGSGKFQKALDQEVAAEAFLQNYMGGVAGGIGGIAGGPASAATGGTGQGTKVQIDEATQQILKDIRDNTRGSGTFQ